MQKVQCHVINLKNPGNRLKNALLKLALEVKKKLYILVRQVLGIITVI